MYNIRQLTALAQIGGINNYTTSDVMQAVPIAPKIMIIRR